jgi:hypothetical protein
MFPIVERQLHYAAKENRSRLVSSDGIAELKPLIAFVQGIKQGIAGGVEISRRQQT